MTLIELFPSLVKISEQPSLFPPFTHCHLWQGTIERRGYGEVWYAGEKWLIHRLAADLNGFDLTTKLSTCHTCDHKNCGAPDHVFMGTHKDNMNDRRKWSAILPPDTIEEIRNCGPLPDMYLAKKYKLTRAEIVAIRSRNYKVAGA